MYNRVGEEGFEYRTLEDLIVHLVDNPGEMFIRAKGCEALVYIREIDEIVLLEDKEFGDADPAVCELVLQRKLNLLKERDGEERT